MQIEDHTPRRQDSSPWEPSTACGINGKVISLSSVAECVVVTERQYSGFLPVIPSPVTHYVTDRPLRLKVCGKLTNLSPSYLYYLIKILSIL